MWFKVDDQSPFHPKIIAVGNQAAGVWMRAGGVMRSHSVS